MTQKFSQTSSVSTEAAQDQVKSGNNVDVEEEKRIIHSLNYSLNLVVLLRLRRPTPFCFLTLQGTTVYESTSADVSLVLWCAVVHMVVSHVISFWMFLGVYARSSLSGRKSSSPCYRFKVLSSRRNG